MQCIDRGVVIVAIQVVHPAGQCLFVRANGTQGRHNNGSDVVGDEIAPVRVPPFAKAVAGKGTYMAVLAFGPFAETLLHRINNLVGGEQGHRSSDHCRQIRAMRLESSIGPNCSIPDALHHHQPLLRGGQDRIACSLGCLVPVREVSLGSPAAADGLLASHCLSLGLVPQVRSHHTAVFVSLRHRHPIHHKPLRCVVLVPGYVPQSFFVRLSRLGGSASQDDAQPDAARVLHNAVQTLQRSQCSQVGIEGEVHSSHLTAGEEHLVAPKDADSVES
mmetsp:Transcript_21491/g.29549  ORF Transcript_21491/g.29549 Transcript_21491/m.29549 type:complete len:275 (-) Transcript_21491:426-1250(-)